MASHTPFTLSSKKKIYGLDWFGAGSQAILIENAIKANKKVVKMVYKCQHLWSICSETQLLELINKTNWFLCEILFQYPLKIYFDIDFTRTEENSEEFEKFDIQTYIDILKNYFEDGDFAISGSEEPIKKSYHIVINNYILENDNDLQNLKYFVKDIKKDFPYFDDKVYTKNRAFKCIYQRKDPSRLPQLPFLGDDKKHFVNSFFPETLYGFEYQNPDMPNLKEHSIPHTIKTKQNFIINPDYHKKLEAFDILDLQEPKNLLKITPINTETDHKHTWKVMLFCFFNKLSFEQFWEWACIKGHHREFKYKQYWDRATKSEFDKFKVSISNFINYLGCFYPILQNTKNFNDIFTNIFTKSLQLPSTILKDRIELQHYNTPHKAIVFNIGMGGGKTTTSIKYLKESQQNFIWISPRITLANNTKGLISEAGIDILNYKTILKPQFKQEAYNTAKNLMISIQSLHYLDKDYSKDIVVVDEIETVLNSLKDNKTHNDKLALNFDRFCSIFKRAKKVILLDAFTTSKTRDFLNDIGIPNDSIIYYTSPYKPTEKQVYLYDKNDFEYTKLLDEIITKINNGDKIYLFYPFRYGNKKRMGIVDIFDHIKKHCPTKNICEPYYGDNEKHKKTLNNVNEYWVKFDCILTTGCISVGVNFDISHFDHIYMFGSSYCGNPRDLLQASMRIRNVSNPILKIFFFHKENLQSFEYPDCYKALGIAYENIIKNIRTEFEADFMKTFEVLCSISNYKIINKPPSLDKDIEHFTNDFNGSVVQFPFDQIDDIDETEIYKLKQRFELDPLELAKVSKFFFFKKYSKMNVKVEDMKWIWDNNFSDCFDNLYSNILLTIYKDNTAKDFRDINFDKIKLSESTREIIKTQYNCLLKSDIKKILEVSQSQLKKSIITSKYDKKSKNTYYKLSKKAIRMYEILDYCELWKSYIDSDEHMEIPEIDL